MDILIKDAVPFLKICAVIGHNYKSKLIFIDKSMNDEESTI